MIHRHQHTLKKWVSLTINSCNSFQPLLVAYFPLLGEIFLPCISNYLSEIKEPTPLFLSTRLVSYSQFLIRFRGTSLLPKTLETILVLQLSTKILTRQQLPSDLASVSLRRMTPDSPLPTTGHSMPQVSHRRERSVGRTQISTVGCVASTPAKAHRARAISTAASTPRAIMRP